MNYRIKTTAMEQCGFKVTYDNAFYVAFPRMIPLRVLKDTASITETLKVRNALPLATLNAFKVGWQTSFASQRGTQGAF